MDRIPIFDGTNYRSWSVKMEGWLSAPSRDFWLTVQNGYNDEPSEEEKQKDDKALSHIRQGVSDWFLPKLEDATTAKQAWAILSQLSTQNVILPIHLRQTAANHLIVATLIATVAFTAGFTMPGGYNGNDGPNHGMAILARKAAFQAFMVTDTIAMLASISAVFFHFDAAITDNQYILRWKVGRAAIYITNAAVAMVLAFVTGTYVVLAHSSGLAISVCVIGCLPLPFFFVTNIAKELSLAPLKRRFGSGSRPTGRDRIPIFDGTNYESWSVKMKDWLSHAARRTVQNGNNDAEALSHIRQGVSDWILPKIENAATANEAWDSLSQLNTENYLRQTAANHLIVATLIATVAFTAGFTMPGGYNGNDGPNQGMAILTRKAAFQAFMVTDTIAMSCSILAVITHFDAAITNNRDTLQKQVNKAAYLISSAAVAMVLAFVTGTYVVLPHSSRFAISVCVIGCLAIPTIFLDKYIGEHSGRPLFVLPNWLSLAVVRPPSLFVLLRRSESAI